MNDISFRVSLRTGDPDTDVKSWIVKAVVVNIDFAAEFLLGLKDIRKMKLFRHIPELVEDVDSDDESVIDERKRLYHTHNLY